MKVDFKDKKVKIISAIAGLIVFITLGFCIAGSKLEKMVESIASQSLHTEVRISRIGVGFSDKSITVRGIEIKNPEGFKEANALVIKKIKIAADSLAGDTIVFSDVAIEGMEVTYELAGAKTNLGELQKSLKRPGQRIQGEAKAQTPSKDVVINKLEITDGRLIPALSIGGKGASAPVPLPDISMSNVGGKGRSISAARAINLVLSEIISTAARTASKQGLMSGAAAVSETVKGAASTATDKMKMILNP